MADKPEMKRANTAAALKGSAKHATDMDAKDLFSMVDDDGSGQIDASEFAQLYEVVREQTEADVMEAMKMEKKAMRANRKVKLFGCFAGLLGAFLAVSVACNFVVMFVVVDSQVKTTLTADGQMVNKAADPSHDGVHETVKMAPAQQYLPLIVAPTLEAHILQEVEQLHVTYQEDKTEGDDEVGDTTVTAINISRAYTVTGYEWESNARMNFTTVSGDRIVIRDGDTMLVKADGTDFAVCASEAKCSAFKAVTGQDVTKLLADSENAINASKAAQVALNEAEALANKKTLNDVPADLRLTVYNITQACPQHSIDEFMDLCAVDVIDIATCDFDIITRDDPQCTNATQTGGAGRRLEVEDVSPDMSHEYVYTNDKPAGETSTPPTHRQMAENKREMSDAVALPTAGHDDDDSEEALDDEQEDGHGRKLWHRHRPHGHWPHWHHPHRPHIHHPHRPHYHLPISCPNWGGKKCGNPRLSCRIRQVTITMNSVCNSFHPDRPVRASIKGQIIIQAGGTSTARANGPPIHGVTPFVSISAHASSTAHVNYVLSAEVDRWGRLRHWSIRFNKPSDPGRPYVDFHFQVGASVGPVAGYVGVHYRFHRNGHCTKRAGAGASASISLGGCSSSYGIGRGVGMGGWGGC